MNEQDIMKLAQALALLSKAASTDIAGLQRMHGPGGIFSVPGPQPDFFNASVNPITGLAARMPVQRSNSVNEVFGVFTGVTAGSGEEADAPCDDGPRAGNLKLCHHIFRFGRMAMDSDPMQIDRAGEVINRSEMVDQRLVGRIVTDARVPELASPQNALRSEQAARLFALNFEYHRRYGPLLYTGNPANSTANEGYIEYSGLESQVNTGKRDIYTNQLCRAADSIVRPFSASIADNAVWFVTEITETIRHLRRLARQTGLDPVELVIVMSPDAFLEASGIWPCVASTYRCTPASSAAQIVINGNEQEAERQRLRDGSYLMVDGQKVEVIQDEMLPETDNSDGTFTSDVYILPLKAGGVNTLYWDYFNLAGPNGMQDAIAEMAPDGFFKVLNEGLYWLTRKAPVNECVQVRLGSKPRVILRTPFLAARLTDITYTPYIKSRSPFPGSDNFYNGGNTAFPFPSPYLYG